MSAAVVLVAAIVLAALLAILLPGAGFIAAVIVVLIGIGIAVWLVAAARSDVSTADVVETHSDPDPLGPGGPDDPSR
jgi:hypothetical protein